jgi:deoxyguanosine kinase
MSKNFTLVSIEGNIGSGKSTLLKYLKQKFSEKSKYIFIDEPVDIWENIKDEFGENMIQKFYSNQEKYSFAFQIMAYTSRLSIIRNAISQESNDHIVIISERSLDTDRYVFAEMLYKQGKIEEVCYQIYLNLFNQFKELYKPDIIIYVNVSPEICYQRVNTRSRTGEEVIGLDYLISCNEQHNHFIYDVLFDCKRLVICGDINIYEEENKYILNEWLNRIDEFIKKFIEKYK